jgi:hypothetical protein
VPVVSLPAEDGRRRRPPAGPALRCSRESSYGHGSAWLVGSPLIAQLPAITRHDVLARFDWTATSIEGDSD